MKLFVVGNLLDFVSEGDKPLSKMLIISDQADVEKGCLIYRKNLAGFAQVTRSKANFIEITPSKCNQRSGFSSRCYQTKSVSQEQVMAIGDSGNDLSMIQYAKVLEVNMGNAREPVKQAADYITPSNNESIMAKGPRQFILIFK